jgi:hypothetical protein
MKMSPSENEKVGQPLWECVPISDYHLPVAPVTQSLRERFAAIQRLFRSGKPEQETPFKANDQLWALRQRQLKHIAPVPQWRNSAEALDIGLKDWLGREKPGHPVIVMVGPPHSGYTEILTAWTKRHRWPVLIPPSARQVLAGDDAWLSEQIKGGSHWVFPALERAYLRHAEGLSLIRRFLARAYTGNLGRGIIGCDSWAWAYLRHVWPARPPITLTLQACGKVRLADHFQRLADPSGDRQLLFRQSDNGRHVLPPPGAEEASGETSNFLQFLAAHSRGIFGIAWAYWRASLRTEPDEKKAEETDIEEGKRLHQTVWVIPWSQLTPLELPSGAGRNEAFVLHTLLLHNGLPLEILQKLLPLSPNHVMETLFRLVESCLVVQDDTTWQVTAQAYPAVRQFLQAGGYLVDQF